MSVIILLMVLFIVTVTSSIFLHAFGEAQHQHRAIQTYVQVDAKVLSSKVTSYRGSKSGVHYIPKITYEYKVNGASYQSSELKAVYVWGDQDWANEVVALYPPGRTCHAFYNPAKPDEAILLRSYSFSPYFDMLEGAFCIAVVFHIGLATWFGRKREPIPADSGWFKLFPEYDAPQRLRVARLSTAIWYGLGAVAFLHYLYCVPPPHASRSMHLFIGFAVLGLIPAAFALRNYRITHRLSEPRLLLNRSAAIPGEEFKFTISQQALRQLNLTSLNVRLRCIATKVRGKSRENTVLLEEHPIALKNHEMRSGEPLELSGAFTITPDQLVTGRDTSGKYTWINWQITQECKIKGGPGYETKFPLIVEATPIHESSRPADLPSGAQVEVQEIASQPAARILSKGHRTVSLLLGFIPVYFTLAGLALMGISFPVVLKDTSFRPPIFLPEHQALEVFIAGGFITLASIALVSTLPNIGEVYLRRIARSAIRRRPGIIVNPDAKDSLFVDVVPRSNWNPFKLEKASDTGFLAVDLERREVRFEGDLQRYRIPAESMCSCTLEKYVAMKNAGPRATGYWLVVIRAYNAKGVWESPFVIRCLKGGSQTKTPPNATKDLHARISSLLPTSSEKPAEALHQA